jgi:hypothetical protein
VRARKRAAHAHVQSEAAALSKTTISLSYDEKKGKLTRRREISITAPQGVKGGGNSGLVPSGGIPTIRRAAALCDGRSGVHKKEYDARVNNVAPTTTTKRNTEALQEKKKRENMMRLILTNRIEKHTDWGSP